MTTEQTSMYCECTPVCDMHYDVDDGTSPTEAVVQALSAVEDVPPTELEPLYEVIDTEALNQLFTHREETSEAPIALSFSVKGWNVFIREDGFIRVCDPDEQVEPAPAFTREASNC